MARTAGEHAPAFMLLDATSPTPKYQQIVEHIKVLIASGQLPPGARLPSMRQLAGDLGINVHTVLVAYHALEAERLLLSRAARVQSYIPAWHAQSPLHPMSSHACGCSSTACAQKRSSSD